MTKEKKKSLAELNYEYEEQKKNMHAQNILWNDKWNEARNPFIAWEQYKEDAHIREPHIKAYKEAREAFFSAKHR